MSDGTAAGVVEFRITRSLGARLNTASDTHCIVLVAQKLAKPIAALFGLRANKQNSLYGKRCILEFLFRVDYICSRRIACRLPHPQQSPIHSLCRTVAIKALLKCFGCGDHLVCGIGSQRSPSDTITWLWQHRLIQHLREHPIWTHTDCNQNRVPESVPETESENEHGNRS